MKEIIKKLFAFLIVTTVLASCLKEGNTNIDLNNPTAPVVTLQWIENGSGSTINSGMQYFGGGTLHYAGSSAADTATYNVALAGTAPINTDLTVTIGVDATKILDNFKGDAVSYELMPDSLYKFLGTTATIKAGSSVAALKIVFYPSKINPTKSYNLPVVIKDAQGKIISSNYGVIYFHTIGNPIAGAYLWDFYRYNNQFATGAPGTTWTNEETVFAPVNPTSVKVPTGYFTAPNYLISFKNTAGVLSDFTAKIAPDEIQAAFTDNGVTVVLGPTITVSSDQKTFTIKYTVYNGSAYRNLTDIYHK